MMKSKGQTVVLSTGFEGQKCRFRHDGWCWGWRRREELEDEFEKFVDDEDEESEGEDEEVAHFGFWGIIVFLH
jgi:hypothetical protein